MKKLYALHILLLILLFFLGQHFLHEHYNVAASRVVQLEPYIIDETVDNGAPSRNYAIYSICVFAISFLIALKTIGRLRILGGILILGAIGYTLWSIAIIIAPKQLSIPETISAWGVYIIVGILLSIFGIFRIDTPSVAIQHYDDQILDDRNL